MYWEIPKIKNGNLPNIIIYYSFALILKVRLPQAEVILVDVGYPMYALWFYCSQIFKLFDFPIFRF
jgi:hypothetical protein